MTNPIIAKVEKLLRLAQDQDGRPEGETAARLAHRMMAAHAIEMAQIDLGKQAEHDPIEEQTMSVKASVWRRLLANAVARHCNCQTSYRSYKGMGGQRITMYGHRTDIEVLQYLYDICERQIETAARKYVNALNSEWYDRGEKKSLGNSFRRSAVHGLWSKLCAIQEETKQENAEGFALVTNRANKVSDWMHDQYGSFRSGRVSSYRHNNSGYQAGRNVSLSAGVSSNGNTKLLGGG